MLENSLEQYQARARHFEIRMRNRQSLKLLPGALLQGLWSSGTVWLEWYRSKVTFEKPAIDVLADAGDAVFRLAYQLRQKGAHEAHDYPYYERERHAYFVFAARTVLLPDHLEDTAHRPS